MSTKVNGIECPSCKDIIYSRANHDFRRCSCEACYIDGGTEYTRMGYDDGDIPQSVTIVVDATKKQLYDDWNNGHDKFGWIKQNLFKGE